MSRYKFARASLAVSVFISSPSMNTKSTILRTYCQVVMHADKRSNELSGSTLLSVGRMLRPNVTAAGLLCYKPLQGGADSDAGGSCASLFEIAPDIRTTPTSGCLSSVRFPKNRRSELDSCGTT